MSLSAQPPLIFLKQIDVVKLFNEDDESLCSASSHTFEPFKRSPVTLLQFTMEISLSTKVITPTIVGLRW